MCEDIRRRAATRATCALSGSDIVIDPVILAQDIRATRGCMRGAREHAANIGLDWNLILGGGYKASDFRATGDALAIRVAEIAEERVNG